MQLNTLRIEYHHPNSNEWTVCQCEFNQIEPKQRVIHQELPKSLAFQIAQQLIQTDRFKVTSNKWLKSGTRVILLEQESLLSDEQLELRVQAMRQSKNISLQEREYCVRRDDNMGIHYLACPPEREVIRHIHQYGSIAAYQVA